MNNSTLSDSAFPVGRQEPGNTGQSDQGYGIQTPVPQPQLQGDVISDHQNTSVKILEALNRLDPSLFGQQQPGLAVPIVSPVIVEPEAKGFTSSEQWVAEMSGFMNSQDSLVFDFKNVNLPSSLNASTPNEWLCTLKTADILSPAEFRSRWDIQKRILDLRNVVFGVKKGIVRTRRLVGVQLERNCYIYQVRESHKIERPAALVVEPAYAAAFVEAVDEATVKCRRLMSAAFPDATNNLQEVTTVCGHGKELLDGTVESTRYLARLAVMFVETAIIADFGPRPVIWDTERLASRKQCGSWVAFRDAMRNDGRSRDGEVNYIPWYQVNSFSLHAEKQYVNVLRFAASRKVRLLIGNEKVKPIYWPGIPNPCFYTSFILNDHDDNTAEYSFSAVDIFTAARMWAHRYSDISILNAMIQQASMLYWKRVGSKAPLLMPHSLPSIAFPRARMRGYVMAPYLAKRDNVTAITTSVGPSSILETVAEAVMGTLLLAFGADSARWSLMSYALQELRMTSSQLVHCTALLRSSETGAALWPIVQNWLNTLGYSGDVGRYMYTLTTMAQSICIKNEDTVHVLRRISSFDILGWFKTIPAGWAAQGWIQPAVLPDSLCKAQNTIKIVDLPPSQALAIFATLHETLDVQLGQIVQHRDMPSISAEWVSNPNRNAWGMPQDLPALAITRENGDRVRWCFKLGINGTFTMGDKTHDRYTLEWYYARRCDQNIQTKPMPGCLNVGDPGVTLPPQQPPAKPNNYDSDRYHQNFKFDIDSDHDDGTKSECSEETEWDESDNTGQNADQSASGEKHTMIEIEDLRPSRADNAEAEGNHAFDAIKNSIQMHLKRYENSKKTESEQPFSKDSAVTKAVPMDSINKKIVSKVIKSKIGLKGGSPHINNKDNQLLTCDKNGRCRPIHWTQDNDDEPPSAGTATLMYGNIEPINDLHERKNSEESSQPSILTQCPSVNDILKHSKKIGIDEQHTMLQLRLTNAPVEKCLHWALEFCYKNPLLHVDTEKELLQWLDAVGMPLEIAVPNAGSPLLGKDVPLAINACDANNMEAEANKYLKSVSWQVPVYTKEEQSFIKDFHYLTLANPSKPIIPLGIQLNEKLFNPFSYKRLMLIIIEVGAMASEHKRPLDQQISAIEMCQNLGIDAAERPLLYECLCLFNNSRTHYERSVAFQAGGCPRAMIFRYGGKWRGRTGLITRINVHQTSCYNALITTVRLRSWFATLNTKEQAIYLMHNHPAVVGAEHIQLLKGKAVGLPSVLDASNERMELLRKIADETLRDHDFGGDAKSRAIGQAFSKAYGEKALYISDMPRRPPKGGFPITFTSTMVKFAYPGSESMMEVLHNLSPNSDESEVAGTSVAILSMPVQVVREMLAHGWFEIPLDTWYKNIKQTLVDIRRSLHFGDVIGEELLCLRKLLNVTIRATGDSDVTIENYHRTALVTRKHWYGWAPYNNDGISAFTHYEERYSKNARDIVFKCYNAMPIDTKNKTIADFWAERALRGATGASKAIKHISFDIKELSPADRPGKKCLVEMLDEEALLRAMRAQPTNRAYYFVKPEPGLKLRSLFAAFDEEAFISAYANQSVENYMRVEPGVMVRQTPADVAEWMAVSVGGLAGPEGTNAYWLSTDYSDYNSEHTMWEMGTLDYYCGKVHSDGSIGTFNYEKAFAHWWLTAGRQRSNVIYGKENKFNNYKGIIFDDDVGGYTPMLNGLYSGARTTARDNTWIHAVDLRIAKEMINAQCGEEVIKWQALCGDDEDVAFHDELTAAIYFSTLAPMGHNLNPIKQMAGKKNHEFLQLTAATEARVEKPLNTLLATLATGNWYVQSGFWVQTAINGVVNNYWECFCRGMPMQNARRLAAITLERAMRVKVDDDAIEDEMPPGCFLAEDGSIKKELEWWNYRHASNLPPLFEFVDGDIIENPPQFEAVADPTPIWPRKASHAYAKRYSKLLQKLPKRIKDEFISHMQQQTVGSVLKVWQQNKARRWCVKHWPARKNEALIHVNEQAPIQSWEHAGKDKVDLAHYRWGMPLKQTMLTEEGVCGRMGVPFFLARKLGGAEKLGGVVSLEQWSRYSDTSTAFYPLKGDGYRLQMNLRAVSTWAQAPVAGVHGEKIKKRWDTMAYIFMGNGAGKTHYCNLHPQAQDIDKVWMDAYGSMREKYSHAAQGSYYSTTERTMQEILTIAAKRGPILLGHVSPKDMIRAAEKARINLRCASYDPGEDVRRSRLSNRGWDCSMVEGRIRRSREGYCDSKQLGLLELHTYDDLLIIMSDIARERDIKELMTGQLEKQPAKYIFDRTEAVSRKLEIEQQESRLLTAH